MKYEQCDVANLTPRELSRITHKHLQARPSDLHHVAYSPMCQTLSKANRERVRHFDSLGHPHSDMAKYHMFCLRRVMTTLTQTYTDPDRTMITIENPIGRFRELPLIRRIASLPHWNMHVADHCMMRNSLDGDEVFPKKPTSLLVYGNLPDLPAMRRCAGACTCLIPGTTRHRHVICNNPDMHPQQRRISNVLDCVILLYHLLVILWMLQFYVLI